MGDPESSPIEPAIPVSAHTQENYDAVFNDKPTLAEDLAGWSDENEISLEASANLGEILVKHGVKL